MIAPTRPVLPSYEDYIEEIKSIWKIGAMTNNGPKLQRLKDELLAYTGVEHLDLFVNGHSALFIILQLMELQGEVITSPFTFVSTTNAIVQAGLVPVFCDIDDTYQIDSSKIEEHITEKTCAIVVPHIFGIPCDVEKIDAIAKQHELKVIYDAAQAFGTLVGGRNIAQFGDATMFSLHAIKIFNSIEGGILSYRDATLSRKLQLYRNFGIDYEAEEVVFFGINAKMDEFRAAMGLCNLKQVEAEIKRREVLATIYKECLSEIEGISTYPYVDEIRYNHAYFPVRIYAEDFGMTRDELFIYLKEKGIGTRKLYDRLISDYCIFKGYRSYTEHANRLKRETLDLPIYGSLSKGDVEMICHAIGEACRSK